MAGTQTLRRQRAKLIESNLLAQYRIAHSPHERQGVAEQERWTGEKVDFMKLGSREDDSAN
ncbi:hypothetical protein [Aurantiacibacter suaedae]|uniref:hypothetical protein n=1 Tax=Aurantiacibacter suaedae TaxID=2545755 RepID=UPI0010F487BE|nr:hypothetical protein [Aurantiacibacter suaedae]